MDHSQLSLEDESSTSTHATSVTGLASVSAKLSPIHGNNTNKLLSFQERRMQTLEMREQAREEKRLEQQRQAEAAIRETQERMRELRSSLMLAQTQQTQVMDSLADMKALSSQSTTTAAAAAVVPPSSDMAPTLAKRRSTAPENGISFYDEEEEPGSNQSYQQELESGAADESATISSGEEPLSDGEQAGKHSRGTGGSEYRGQEKKETNREFLLKRHLAKRGRIPDAATSSQTTNATPPRRRSTLDESNASSSQNSIDQWKAQRESLNESQQHQSAADWREVKQADNNRNSRGGKKRGNRRSSSKQPKGLSRGGSVTSRNNAGNPPRGVRRRRSSSLTAMNGQRGRGRGSAKPTAPPSTRKVGMKNYIKNEPGSLSQSERGVDSRTDRGKGRRSSSSTPTSRKRRTHSSSVAADPLSQSERGLNFISTEKEEPSFNWPSYRKGQRRHTIMTPLATTVISNPQKGKKDYVTPTKVKRCHTTGSDTASKHPHDSIRLLQQSQVEQAALFQETLNLIQYESDSMASLEDDLVSRHRRRLQNEPSPLESLSQQRQTVQPKTSTHGLRFESPKTKNDPTSLSSSVRNLLPSPTPPSYSHSSRSLLDSMPSSSHVHEHFLGMDGVIHDDQNEGTSYFCPDNILHLSSSWNDLFSSSKTSINQQQVNIPRRRGSFDNISLGSSGSDILHFEPEAAEELESAEAGVAEGAGATPAAQEDLLRLSGSLPDIFMNDDEVNEADEENMQSWDGQNTQVFNNTGIKEQLTFEDKNQDSLPTDPNAIFWQQAQLENSGNSFASVFDCLSHSSDDPSTLLRHLKTQQSRGKPPFRWDVSSHHGNSTIASNSLKGSRHSRHSRHAKSNPMKELRKQHQRGDKRKKEIDDNNVEDRKQEPSLSRLSHSKRDKQARKNERQDLPNSSSAHAMKNSISKLPEPRKGKEERNTPARTRSTSLSDMERLCNQRRLSSVDVSDEENTTQESSISDDQKITKYIDLVGGLITKDQEQTFGGGPTYSWENSRSHRPASYDWMNHQTSDSKEGMLALAASENTGTTHPNGGVQRQRSSSLTDLVIVVKKEIDEELEDPDYDWAHCTSSDPIETSDSIAHFTGVSASGALCGLMAENENRRKLLSEGQEQSFASRSMRSNDTAARKPMRRSTGALVQNFEEKIAHVTDSQSFNDSIQDSDGSTPPGFSEVKPRLPESSTSLGTFFNTSNSAANKSANDIERIFGWTAALRMGELDKSAHPSGDIIDAGPKTAHDAVSGENPADIFPLQQGEALYEEDTSKGVTKVHTAASLQDFIRSGSSADEKQGNNGDCRTIDHTINTGGAVHNTITKPGAPREKVEKLDPIIVDEGIGSERMKDAGEGQEAEAGREKKIRRASRRHHSNEKGPTSQLKEHKKRGGGRKSMKNRSGLHRAVKNVNTTRGRDLSNKVSSRSRSQSLTSFLKTEPDGKEADGVNIGISSRGGGERTHETGQSGWYRKSTRRQEHEHKKSKRKESGISENKVNRHQRSRSQSLADAERRKSRSSSRVSKKDRRRKSSRDRLATSAHLNLSGLNYVEKSGAIEGRGRERPILGRFRSSSLTEVGSLDRELHSARSGSVTKKVGAKTLKKAKNRISQKHNVLPGLKKGSSRRRPQRQRSRSLTDMQLPKRTEEQPTDTPEPLRQNLPVLQTYDWKQHSLSARSFVSSSPSSPVDLTNDRRGSLIRSRSQSLSNLFGDKREPSKSSRTMTKRVSGTDVHNDNSGRPGMHSYDWKTHSTSTRSMMSNSARPERDRRSMLSRTQSESLSNVYGENRNPSEPGRATVKKAGDGSQSRSNDRSSRTKMLSYDWKKHSVSDRSMMPDAVNSARDRRSTLIRSRSQSLSNLFGDKREPSESSRHIPKRTDDDNRSASNGKRSCPSTRSYNWKKHSVPDRSTSKDVSSDKDRRSTLVRSRSVSLSNLFSDKREPSESSRHMPKRTSDETASHGSHGTENSPNTRSYNWTKHSLPDNSTTSDPAISSRDHRSTLVGLRSVSLSNVFGGTSIGHTDNASTASFSTRGGAYDWTAHEAHTRKVSGDIEIGSTSRSSRAIHRRNYSVASDSSEEDVRNSMHSFESAAGQSTSERSGGTPYEYGVNSKYEGSTRRPRDGAEELSSNSGGRDHEALYRSMSDLSSLVISSIAEDPNENSDKSKLSLMDSSADDLLFRSSSSLQKANGPVAGAANTATQTRPHETASDESKRSTDTTLSGVTASSSFITGAEE